MVQEYSIRDLPYNAIRNARELGRDFSTATGVVLQGGLQYVDDLRRASKETSTPQAIKNAFIKAVNNPKVQSTLTGAGLGALAGSEIPVLGTAGGAVAGGLIGLLGPKEYADANLSTYHTSVDKLSRGETTLHDVTQGMLENPVTTALDVLSLGGAKQISKLSHKLDKIDRPDWVDAIIPSESTKKFHHEITESLNKTKQHNEKIYSGLNELYQSPFADREKLVKYIMTNDSTGMGGSEVALGDKIVSSIRQGEEVIGKNWLHPSELRNNVISQYVMNKLSKGNKALLHDDIMGFLTTGNISENLGKAISSTKDGYNNLIDHIAKGSKLYDEGKIAYVSQAIANTVDPSGQIVARDINKGAQNYFETRRVIGRAQEKELGKVLDKTLSFQFDKINKAREAQDLLDGLLMRNGRKIKSGEALKAGEVFVKPEDIKKGIAKFFAGYDERELQGAFKGSNTIKANEGIAISKRYLDAMKNSLVNTNSHPLSGLFNMTNRNLLAQPHWFGLNRVGNMSNNAMFGVGVEDYKDAIRLYKQAPDKLKQQTSYSHFVSDELDPQSSLVQSVAPAFNKVVHSLDGLSLHKNYDNYKKAFADIVTGLNEITTEPFFKVESRAELLDRFANFIHHAKQEGVETSKSIDEIVKEANKNDKLYEKINRKVNKQLGDYVGRNYSLPPEVYSHLKPLVPFYRFITQTARTSGHALSDRGLALQSLALSPSKIGKDISNEVVTQLGLDPTTYSGGYPYKVDATGGIRTIGFEPLPIQAVLGDIGNLASLNPEGGQIFNPYLNIISDVTKGEKFGRPIKSINTEMQRAMGIPYDMVEPTISDRWKYGGVRLLDLLFAPYKATHTYIPEITQTIMGGGIKSGLDTNPFIGVPTSYTRRGGVELIGRYGGVETKPQLKYYRKVIKPSTLNKNIMKYQSKLIR